MPFIFLFNKYFEPGNLQGGSKISKSLKSSSMQTPDKLNLTMKARRHKKPSKFVTSAAGYRGENDSSKSKKFSYEEGPVSSSLEVDEES